jgi:uncharacterized membrane protein
MRTPASIARHPIHPMIVPVPIGLWLFSLVCDLVFRFGGGSANWELVAWYTMIGGIVGALIAAVPGFIDLLSLPKNVQRVAITHMALNLTIVALFAINAYVRRDGVTDVAIGLSVIAVALLVVSGWLGGKMVYEHGAAVDTQASLYRGPERRKAASRTAYLGPDRRMAIQ